MSYKVEVVPGEPVILVTLTEESHILEDMPKSGIEASVLLDQAREITSSYQNRSHKYRSVYTKMA